MTLSSPINDYYFHEWFSRPIVSNAEISSCSNTNLVDMSNICLSVRSVVFTMDWQFQVILSHEYCWCHCYSHEHSPNHRMFLSIFCNIHWGSFLSFSHLIIHPVQEWSCFYWVSNDELLRPCSSLRIDIGSPCLSRSITSFTTDCAVPLWWISSWEIGSPRSLTHRTVSFPLLRRPSMVIIPLWVACWGESFHKLLMITVVESFLSVDADIRSPWSLLFLSITSLHRACWSRRWYVRRHPCKKAHHWPRFCCDSFFSWIVLRSFRHCFRAHPWLACLRVGFWCQCTWFGFFGPNWFDRITNQGQLCGSWKHVSL